MKHLFIINPAAGSRDRTAEYSAAIRTACDARRLDYEIRVSMGPGDCANIAREPPPGRKFESTPAAGTAP